MLSERGPGLWALITPRGTRSPDLAVPPTLSDVNRRNVWRRAAGSGSAGSGLGKGGFAETPKGRAGIGLILDPHMQVMSLNAGGPAQTSGLVQVGDKIVAVDGVLVLGTPLPTMANLIAGPAGTPVRITVERTVELKRNLKTKQ
mmetsp:Transcript_22565/g.53495  ORF Transcript_22565/g.53495 Transcript_22565/m.53495 type:complete len:144 (+) Transcript_22565:419-850(+)